ncbi:MAG: flagellar biosynthesis anti-sigma factor FlgM [Geobacteraceae bacterium GWC2_58_44]|nr:MAG: flagellar biosynthesis anti-sigma factor FlgM [Geobacteraceae bacterium GWC2_58_44]
MRIEGAPYLVNLSRPEAVRKEGAQPEAVQATPAPARPRSFDRVELSRESRELERLKRELAALPDVRLDRVALAKQNLQDGVYRVTSAVSAQRMMEAYGKR